MKLATEIQIWYIISKLLVSICKHDFRISKYNSFQLSLKLNSCPTFRQSDNFSFLFQFGWTQMKKCKLKSTDWWLTNNY